VVEDIDAFMLRVWNRFFGRDSEGTLPELREWVEADRAEVARTASAPPAEPALASPPTMEGLLSVLRRRRAQYCATAPVEGLPHWMTTVPEVLRVAEPGSSFPCRCGAPAIARLRHPGADVFTVSALTGGVCCSRLVPEVWEL